MFWGDPAGGRSAMVSLSISELNSKKLNEIFAGYFWMIAKTMLWGDLADKKCDFIALYQTGRLQEDALHSTREH